MRQLSTLLFSALLSGVLLSGQLFGQTTLEAGPGILRGDGSGNQAWGPDVTLSARRINGQPGRVAYESKFTDNGFGVAGGRWLQIDYYQDYQGQRVNASEQFIITFKRPATDVILEVGQLDPREGWQRESLQRDCKDKTGRKKVDESGKYTAYDQNGRVIGSGVLVPANSLGGQLPGSAGGYRFNIRSGGKAIKKIVLEATQWGGDRLGCVRYRNDYSRQPTNDSDNTENNSDFNVSGLTYTLVDDNPQPPSPSINQTAVIVSKANPGFTLQVNNTANRTSAVVEARDDKGQVWTISDRGNGFHKIVNNFANKALEAWQRNPGNGDDITIYSANNKDWQQWEFIEAGNGYFRIKGKYNPRFMTLSNGNAVMLSESGQDEQLWQLVDPNSVDINARAENNPPVAVRDGAFSTPRGNPDFSVNEGGTLVIPFSRLLANDSDPDGDPLTIIEVESVRGGSATIVGNTVEFRAIDRASSASVLIYTISDGRGGTASTTASVLVRQFDYEPIALTATGIQPNGRPEPLAWGSCAEIAAFSASGTPTAVTLKKGRAGVKGNRFDKQLDYDPVTNTSEKLEINFNQFVGRVSFVVGNLETNEWQGADETGTWTLLDDNDNILSQGIISPTAGTAQGNSVYRFSISTSGRSPAKLVLEATAYDSGNGPQRTENNSDYSLISVTYTPVEYTCYKSVSSLTNDAPVIYPNAVQNTLNVKMDEHRDEQVLRITVYDQSGNVQQEIDASAAQQESFTIQDMKAGTYLVKMTTSQGEYSYRILKE